MVGRLVQVSGLLEKLKEVERHEGDLKTIQKDLQELPAEPGAAARQARLAVDRLTQIAGVLPLLTRFDAYRLELRNVVTLEQTIATQMAERRAKGESA